MLPQGERLRSIRTPGSGCTVVRGPLLYQVFGLAPADLKTLALAFTLALALALTLALSLAISKALAVALAILLPALLTRVLTFIHLELVLVAYPLLLLLLRRAEIRLVAQLLPVLQLGALFLLRVGGAYGYGERQRDEIDVLSCVAVHDGFPSWG